MLCGFSIPLGSALPGCVRVILTFNQDGTMKWPCPKGGMPYGEKARFVGRDG
jgi:hypothetical protein